MEKLLKRKVLIEKFEKGKFVNERGDTYWENEYKELHRDGDRPAIIYAEGDKVWYQNGQHHRDGDKPAVIYSDGSKHWYQNGQRHRDEDKPAVINSNGNKYWYKNGQLIKEEINNE